MKCAKKKCPNDAIEDEVYCSKCLRGLGGTETRLSEGRKSAPTTRKKVASKKKVQRKAKK